MKEEPFASAKALHAEVAGGMVLFTFESVAAEFGDPSSLPELDLKVEPWGLKDAHLPETVKEHMYGESVTGYLYDRKALEEYESMMNRAITAETSSEGVQGGENTESDHAGTTESNEPANSDPAGGSGSSLPGGPQDSGPLGGGGQDPVLLDPGASPQVSG